MLHGDALQSPVVSVKAWPAIRCYSIPLWSERLSKLGPLIFYLSLGGRYKYPLSWGGTSTHAIVRIRN